MMARLFRPLLKVRDLYLDAQTRHVELLLLLFIAGAYAVLWTSYRPYNIDDVWYTSFSYNLCHKGSELDDVFGDTFPRGMGGTIIFGKIPAYLTCGFFDLFGWTRSAIQAFAKTTSLLGVVFLAAALIRSGVNARTVFHYSIALIAIEPFFNMANQGRYECVTFLLLGVALWLAAHRRQVLAGFICCAAVEAQPVGLLAPIIVGVFVAVGEPGMNRVRALVKFGCGLILFLPLYLIVHPHWRDAIGGMGAAASSKTEPMPGTLVSYFFQTKYYRHIPELVVMTAAAVVYARGRRGARSAFAAAATIAAALFFIFSPWTNFNYIIFFYVPAMLLLFAVAEAFGKTFWLYVACCLYVLPQYGLAWYITRRDGIAQSEILEIRQAILAAARNDSRPTLVAGDYDLWFAYPENFVARRDSPGKVAYPTLVVCVSGVASPNASQRDCTSVEGQPGMRLVSQHKLKRLDVSIYATASGATQ